MDEKQLDFNQPLLSVRRFSPKLAPETDNKRKANNSLVRLPPPPAYKSDLKSGPVSHPGTVPFIWEQIPGRPKDESKLPTLAVEQPPLTPNLPPGRVLKVKQQDSDQISKGSTISNSQNVTSSDKNATKHKSPQEAMPEEASSDSDDGDEAYQDALDAHSTTGSFFMNCSVSGLSGLDDQELQLFGSFSRDQQARNFMIGRFLPAAKAIASEKPQYTSRKPLVAQEEPRQVKEAVSRQRYSPLRQIVLSDYAQDIGKEESEDEDDIDNGSENYATKVCGLFPRFCLLNPLPGLRMEDRVLSSAAHGMQGKSSASQSGTRKKHARTAYSEKKSVVSQFGFREEKLKNGIDPHRRGCSKLSACEGTPSDFGCASPVVEKTLYVDSVHKVKSHSSSSSSTMKGQTNHRWEHIETLNKDSDNCKKPSIEPKSSESLDLSLVSCPDRSSNDMQMDITNHSNKIELEKQRLTKPLEHEIDLDQNSMMSSPKVAQCKKILPENLVIGNQENFDGPIKNLGSWRSSRLVGDVEVDSKSLLAAQSTDQECTEAASDGKIDLENQWLMRPGNGENSDAMHLRLPLALPSPKAPSESWLKQTLPTISSRNISLRSYAAAYIPAHSRTPNTATLAPKWETIVKFSKELAPIPDD